MPKPAPCPTCNAETEHWWSYCAMCGHWIAAHPYKMDAPFDPTARAIMRGEPVISEQGTNLG
jgi:hypothetical protein